jgi:NADP-dependent alcohol dehydrogenase
VISRNTTSEKLAFYAACVFPVFSVLDPETTYTLPAKQVRNGIVDAFVHVTEQYMTYPDAAPLQDRLAEAILATLIEVGPRTLVEPRDYESRASFMWSATLSLNTLIGCGVPQDWSTHMIGHELTALYGPAHAETLAVVLPGVWTHEIDKKEAKLRQYGQRVWGVTTAEAAIARTEEFFHSLDMPTRLSAYQINAEEAAEAVGRRFAERAAKFGEHEDIGGDVAAAILRSRA